MAISYQMTWVPGGRRWRKVYKGKAHYVSCRQLGTAETKEASWRAANAWWERQQALLDLPGDDDRMARAVRVRNLVEDFSQLDDEARREAVDALLGAGSYDSLKAKARTMLAGMEASSPERTTTAQVEGWKNLLRDVCQAGQLSVGRYDAYCRNIGNFVAWIGPETPIDAIDEANLEAFFSYLSGKVGAGDYSPQYAHTLLMTARQFISRLAARKLIPLPGNIRDRRFRFNHSVAAEIETFTAEEVHALLAAAPERTRLYLLLMLNCGMYQNDIAELRQQEVDWKKGTITRARSKTRERKGPVVTYKLWPETLALLKQHRAEGELALTTERGKPLVSYSLEEGKFARYDVIQSAWNRLSEKMGGKVRLSMKHLRKTSASLLGEHPHYKFYATHFLADSPRHMTEKHYVKPSDAEFFEALDWLHGRILAEGE
jgi:integrase